MTIPAGSTSATVPLSAKCDFKVESGEGVRVTLQAGTTSTYGIGTNDEVNIKIADSCPPALEVTGGGDINCVTNPAMRINAGLSSKLKSNPGGAGIVGKRVYVEFTATHTGGISASDYLILPADNGDRFIPPGWDRPVNAISIRFLNKKIPKDASLTLTLKQSTLTSTTNARLHPDKNTITFTVASDTACPGTTGTSTPTVSVTAQSAEVDEGQPACFAVSVAPTHDEALDVPVTITETGGGDHVDAADETTTTITISARVPRVTHCVPTTDDNIDESDTTVTATAATGAGYRLGQSTVSQTVNDNDTTVTITAVTDAVDEGDPVKFTITRTETDGTLPIDVTVTGTCVTQNRLLNAGQGGPRAVRILDSETSVTFKVETLDDTKYHEHSCEVTATIVAGTGYQINGGAASAKLHDNETAPVTAPTCDNLETWDPVLERCVLNITR